ncbi:MAG: YkoF family thiamine/hydroxymethylpyrimidine-binding protein [Planctomycetota bacterium]|nr:YkoF family thiamine/hydroxymethylpyrimidine-binding protein [Planctomycetota bacterium]
MKVQVEVSLYPLRTATLTGPIDDFVEHLRRAGFEVEIGPMGSRINGECKDIFGALGEAFEDAAGGSDAVLTVKASNACPSGRREGE